MLQPKSYPELLGKTLVLEAEPFVTMADDDNPWVEGLFMTVTVGFLIGVARVIGGLLMTASLPPAPAVLEALLQGWRQLSLSLTTGADGQMVESIIREMWNNVSFVTGYGAGWSRLLYLISIPTFLTVQWLFYGSVGYVAAKLLGGRGSFNDTLGASALIVAPQLLLLFSVIPFVSVSRLLLAGWSVLIIYRGLAVAQDLPWKRAVVAALAPVLVLVLLSFIFSALVGLLVSLGGF